MTNFMLHHSILAYNKIVDNRARLNIFNFLSKKQQMDLIDKQLYKELMLLCDTVTSGGIK